jgi:malate dehydrogenase (oxaloacetate-decarboxylating)
MAYQVVRTIRFKNVNTPGILGKLTTAIGKTGTIIGTIKTVHMGNHFVIRDIDVLVDGKEHLTHVLEEVSKIQEIKILEIRDAVLEIHRNGLIKMTNAFPINTIEDVQKIYIPGVAEVCRLIADNINWKDTYTSIPYNVAIVTDGSSVLEFGNIGPVAEMPIIEGKAAMLRKLVRISGIPILMDSHKPEDIVELVKRIALTFGGIQLTGIVSPQCFEIYKRLEKELNIPVMHDDQQGNAVVALAALINACKRCNLELEKVKIGIIGLGTTGFSIGKLLMQYTGNSVLGTTKSQASMGRFVDINGTLSSLEEIMETANIVIATTSRGDVIKPEMVKKGQIIFALSQPHSEIAPELAREAGAALAINSRAINNLLSCPGIWRGTLDAKAPKINFEMYKAAARAIANAATEEEILPTTLDAKVHLAVAHGVAKAAIKTGIAQRRLDDDYFEVTNIKMLPWS